MPVEERGLTSDTLGKGIRVWRVVHAYNLRSKTRYPGNKLGFLVKLPTAGSVYLKATAVGEPDAGNPHVRFDERDVETEHGKATEAPSDERGGKQIGLS